MELPAEARALLESDALAHLVTLNADGSPQVSIVWVGLDGDEIVSAHLRPQQKLRNIRRDPRIVLSLEGTETTSIGLREYLVVRGRARIEEAPPTGSSTSPAPTSARTRFFRRWPIRRPAGAP